MEGRVFWGSPCSRKPKEKSISYFRCCGCLSSETAFSPLHSFLREKNGFLQRIQLRVDVGISTDKHVPTQLCSVFKTKVFYINIFDYCKAVHLIPGILEKKRKVIPFQQNKIQESEVVVLSYINIYNKSRNFCFLEQIVNLTSDCGIK